MLVLKLKLWVIYCAVKEYRLEDDLIVYVSETSLWRPTILFGSPSFWGFFMVDVLVVFLLSRPLRSYRFRVIVFDEVNDDDLRIWFSSVIRPVASLVSSFFSCCVACLVVGITNLSLMNHPLVFYSWAHCASFVKWSRESY